MLNNFGTRITMYRIMILCQMYPARLTKTFQIFLARVRKVSPILLAREVKPYQISIFHGRWNYVECAFRMVNYILCQIPNTWHTQKKAVPKPVPNTIWHILNPNQMYLAPSYLGRSQNRAKAVPNCIWHTFLSIWHAFPPSQILVFLVVSSG